MTEVTEEIEVSSKPTRTKNMNTKADAVLSMFDQISEDVLKSVQSKIDRRVASKVKALEEAINSARPIYVVSPQFESKPIAGVQHHNFETLIHIVSAGQPVMLVGPAGTGKSHAAESVAEVLGLEFFAMSVGAQTSKSDLIGYMDAMKNYVSTPFRRAYEEGGLFLLDEIDAGNSNVLIQLNAALANGYMSFPDAMVRRHENFRFVASANTFGLGANRQYVGRNQLDAATLDRFVTLQWNIDDNVESSLAVGRFGAPWLSVVRMVRKYVEERELRVVVSPRATQRGARLIAAGLDFNDVLHMALLSQFDTDAKKELHVQAHTEWRERCAELPEEEEVEDELRVAVDETSSSDGIVVDGVSDESDDCDVVPLSDVVVSWEMMRQAADCSTIEMAYRTLFGSALDFEASDITRDVAQNIVMVMSEPALRWKAVLTLLEVPCENWEKEELKVAVVQRLFNEGWDFRSSLNEYLVSIGQR